MRLFTSRLLAAAALALVLNGFSAAPGVIGAPAFAQAAVEVEVTDEAIEKMNAYVEFLNRSMRASESLERYASWVDMKKGPSGKESIIYGLYSLYDVRSEIAAVEAAAKSEPKMPELDAAILAYVETYKKIAPAIEKANKYYERQDYKSDRMEGGKAYHKDIAALADTYEEHRRTADAALRSEKVKLDLASLNELEKAEGKKSRWHVRNVMFRAEAMMDLMPDNDRPVVDMKAFRTALAD